MKRHDLPTLLSSRICHDLVSPVGAMQNAAELMEEIAPPGLEEELGLIRQSSRRAADLLKFYRIAFGAADPESTVSLADLRDQAAAVVASNRTEWTWTGMDAGETPRAAARLGAVMILCARAATQLGGRVSVSVGGEGHLRVVASSERISLSDLQDALLEGRVAETPPGPREIEFALLEPWAEAADYRLQASRGQGGLCLEARPMAPVQPMAAGAG